MRVVKLRTVAGNLTATIPRALARELELTPHSYVVIRRVGIRRLEITPVERNPNAAR